MTNEGRFLTSRTATSFAGSELMLRCRFEVRNLLGQAPWYTEYLRRKRSMLHLDDGPGWDMGVVGPHTEIVIDSFLRSGNTFALAAFTSSQPGRRQIGHHACLGGQVRAAVVRQIPVILIARAPQPTVVSCSVWNPTYHVSQWLRAYTRYYEAVEKVAPDVVVASFEDVVSDFGAVIEDANARYGTDFAPYDHTTEAVEHCFRLIEQNDITRFGRIAEAQVSRPSTERLSARQRAIVHYHDARLTKWRVRAERAYRAVIAHTRSESAVVEEKNRA